MYMLQQGTAFVYQGQEIGMLNTELDSLDEYEDCFVKNNYNVARNKVHLNEENAGSGQLSQQEITQEHLFSGMPMKTQALQQASPGFP